MARHPAFNVPFSQLICELNSAKDAGLVSAKTKGDLTLWTYTNEAQYKKIWNNATTCARGLITDGSKIVALPFPKFFNLSEMGPEWEMPLGEPEIFSKEDGSMGIFYECNGQWFCATKGSFESDQAKWGQAFLDDCNKRFLNPDWTYLVEMVYPENKIVVDYQGAEFVAVLAAYDRCTGHEVPYQTVLDSMYAAKPRSMDWGKRYPMVASVRSSKSDISGLIVEMANNDPGNTEGYVVRWPDGTRVKMKYEQYLLMHKAISNLSPLAVWEAMCGGQLSDVRSNLPEELWDTFDQYLDALDAKLRRIVHDVIQAHAITMHLSARDLGIYIKNGEDFGVSDKDNLVFLWDYRKHNNDANKPPWPNKDCKAWPALMRKIRPTSNSLE